MPKEPRDQHCAICGEFIGRYVSYYSDRDTCGSIACEREMLAIEREEREQAHRDLDRERGWD